jgi:hypothetical protein
MYVNLVLYIYIYIYTGNCGKIQGLSVVWRQIVLFCFTFLCTYNISNIEILARFQSKALRMIVDAPWYVPNTVIRRNLQIPTVTEEIRRYSSQYSARLSVHPNYLTVNLIELLDNR